MVQAQTVATSSRTCRATSRGEVMEITSAGMTWEKSPKAPSTWALFWGRPRVARMRSVAPSAASTSGVWFEGRLSSRTASGDSPVVSTPDAKASATARASSVSLAVRPTMASAWASTISSRLKANRSSSICTVTALPSPTHCAPEKKVSKAPRSASSSGERPWRWPRRRAPQASRIEAMAPRFSGTRQCCWMWSQNSRKPPCHRVHSVHTVCVQSPSVVVLPAPDSALAATLSSASLQSASAGTESQSFTVPRGTSSASAKTSSASSEYFCRSDSTCSRKLWV
ncbi:MAG: hypothetical protein BWX69_03199 [Planctomycetes bacterium ADurb.Bin069]|nr:MAG: hypothetical protein BWX69_03199 [Planctomycetes bacterium ADurb.Bin069]